jgi:predicted Zn-dependent protease
MITATPEAQAWFDQGLSLLHDFWDYESSRAFEQGLRVDPKCAMCYWGLYQAQKFAHSDNNFYAKQALTKAEGLKRNVSKMERYYIEASVASEEKEGAGEDHDKNTEEVRIYRKMVKQYPRDKQARIYLANSLFDGYEEGGEPKAATKEALQIFQAVMKDDPNDSAANHYWIHLVEASPHPEQALHSAEILGSLAPASGHMVHMPGHIFYRMGEYGRAKQSFAASTQADEHYMESQHVDVDNVWNYVHNLMYSIANLLEAGQLKEATELSAKVKKGRGELETTLYLWSPRDSISRLDPRLPVALRSADWPQVLELLKVSDTNPHHPNLHALAQELTRLAQGMQALDAHDLATAEKASEQFDAALWRLSNRAKDEADVKAKEDEKNKKDTDSKPPTFQISPDALPDTLVTSLSIMSLELRAGLEMAKGQVEEAKKLYAQASREQKALGYHEPPTYIRPVGETEAAAYMTASRWDDAKVAYKRALEDRPRSGFPLFGMAQASERAGDEAAARTEYTEFLEAWKSADPDLPQVAHARAYLAARPQTGK